MGRKFSNVVGPPLLSAWMWPHWKVNTVIGLLHQLTVHLEEKVSPSDWIHTCSRRAAAIRFFFGLKGIIVDGFVIFLRLWCAVSLACDFNCSCFLAAILIELKPTLNEVDSLRLWPELYRRGRELGRRCTCIDILGTWYLIVGVLTCKIRLLGHNRYNLWKDTECTWNWHRTT